MRIKLKGVLFSVAVLACYSSVSEEPDRAAAIEAKPYDADSTMLVMADASNATDTLVLTITVDDLIHNHMSEWPYRRTEKQKEKIPDGILRSASGRAQSTHADGMGGNGYGLLLSPDPLGDVSGSNIVFSIQYSGTRAGKRQKGEATIVVPVSGTASGQINRVRFKSEWKSNQASDAAGVKVAP